MNLKYKTEAHQFFVVNKINAFWFCFDFVPKSKHEPKSFIMQIAGRGLGALRNFMVTNS